MRFLTIVLVAVMAMNFSPFPTDQEIYGSLAGGDYLPQRVGQAGLVVCAALAGLALLTGGVSFSSSIRTAQLIWPVPALWLLMGASIIWSHDQGRSAYQFVVQTVVVVTILTLVPLRLDKTISVIRRAIILALAASVVVYMIYPDRASHVIGAGVLLNSSLDGLFRGGFIHKNYGAGVVAYLAAIGAALAMFRETRATGLFSLIAAAAFLYASGSVAGAMAPIIGVSMSLVIYACRKARVVTATASAVIAITVCALPFTAAFYLYPSFSISVDGRAQIWTANVYAAEGRELLGAGLQAVYSTAQSLIPFDTSGYIARVGSHSHSAAMEAYGQLGIVGLLLCLAFIFVAVRNSVRLTTIFPDNPYALAGLFCVTTAAARACVEPDFIGHRAHWYLFVLVAVATAATIRHHQSTTARGVATRESRLEVPTSRLSK